MAYVINDLMETYGKEYKISANVCGSSMNKEISWVEKVDDVTDFSFLAGSELVVFSGRGRSERETMLSFLAEMKEKNVSAVMLYAGPQMTVQQYMVDYCSDVDLTLLVMPWGMDIHAFTKKVCMNIAHLQMTSFDAGQIMRNMIYFPREAKQHYKELEVRGFDLNANFVAFVLEIDFPQNSLDSYHTKFQMHCDRWMEQMHLHYGFWSYEGAKGKGYVFVVNGAGDYVFDEVLGYLKNGFIVRSGILVSVAVGPKGGTIRNLPESVKKTLRISQLALRRGEPFLCYDEMTIDKVFLCVDNMEVLREYYNEVLGSLISYDAQHGTDYVGVLRCYLENEGSVQATAEKLFVHRNTINYQINKIKEITEIDISSLQQRCSMMMALRIGDYIS